MNTSLKAALLGCHARRLHAPRLARRAGAAGPPQADVGADGRDRARGPRCHLQDQRRRARAVAGHGHALVSHRGVRPAADELAQHPRGRGVGDRSGWREWGLTQPAPGSVGPVRPRLGEREVHRQRRHAAAVSAHRVCPGVDARHQRRRHRRRGPGRRRSRRGFQQVAGQAEGQGRARGANDRR